jgi:ferredoxin-NADP reductase
MRTRLVEKRMVAERTLAFRLELDGGRMEFHAGQACEMTLLDPRHEDDKGGARIFSIASSPAEPRLLFATRLTGSGFKRSLEEGPIGMELEADGPFGSFTLHEDEQRPAVFLAGGIGITPFLAMIRDATERSLGTRMTLLYSNRNAAGVAFLEDLERHARDNPRFKLVATLTDPTPGGTWNHATGRIDLAFLEPHVAANRDAVFYVAGPDGFVTAMGENLSRAGVEAAAIRAEGFAGY